MTSPRHYMIVTPTVLRIAAIVIAAAVFVADTITELEIAVAVLYVAVVLIAVRILPRRSVVLVSAICIALTVLSALLSRGDPSRSTGVINCLISIAAIIATTYLGLRNQSASLALQDAREKLAHANRVTTLGELAASIAHEVNQPLAAVIASGNACVHWLAATPPNLEKAGQAVGRIVRDANRASEVIRRVRGLAKRSPPQQDRLNINEIITEMIVLMDSEVHRNRISLKIELADGLPLVLGDRIQLQQVILNLMVNAIEAINAAGEGPRELLIRSVADDSEGVLVAVQDSGAGLGPAKREQLFDAFHTTKPDGMGMGLAISRSIIEDHGGRVWASPNTPRGAVFRFTLPTGRNEEA